MKRCYDNGGIRVEDIEKCYVCTSDGVILYNSLIDRIFGVSGIWNLMECPQCGLIWITPRTISADMGKLYTNYYTHETTPPPQTSYGLRGFMKKIQSDLLSLDRGIVTCLEDINIGRLLDIGCGKGDFLSQMKNRGWEVVGVDSDVEAIHVAREHYGIEAYQGTLEDVRLKSDSFDAITMNHVIEHIVDPIGTLQECKRLLKRDGKVFIVTPNAEGLGRKFFKSAWVHWDPPRHIFLFSRKTLAVCAEESGFKVLQLRTNIDDAGSVWKASKLIQRKNSVHIYELDSMSLYDNLRGILFVLAEYLLLKMNRGRGEEIVMTLTKT